MSDSEKNDDKTGLDILLGFLLGLAIVAVATAVCGLGAALFVQQEALIVLGFFGFVQVPFTAAAATLLTRNGRSALAKGVLVAAGIAFLLNGACWGLFILG